MEVNIITRSGKEYNNCSCFPPSDRLSDKPITDINILNHVLNGGYDVIIKNENEGFKRIINTRNIAEFKIVE